MLTPSTSFKVPSILAMTMLDLSKWVPSCSQIGASCLQ